MKNFIAALIALSGIVLLTSAIAFTALQRGVGSHRYNQAIYFNWSLANNAATIPQKAEYIDKLVSSLRDSGLQGRYSSLFSSTKENSFDENFKDLLILQEKLNRIKGMDENSPAYQAAIRQITDEQGQTDEMLRVFTSCWWQANYYYLWNPFVLMCLILLPVLLVGLGAALSRR